MRNVAFPIKNSSSLRLVQMKSVSLELGLNSIVTILVLIFIFLDIAARSGLGLCLVYFGGRHWINDLHGMLVDDTRGVACT